MISNNQIFKFTCGVVVVFAGKETTFFASLMATRKYYLAVILCFFLLDSMNINLDIVRI